MNSYVSDKIKVLYTVLIIMVVYIHSYYIEAEQYKTALFIQRFTGELCGICNSLFFCISGYLFERNINSLKDVFKKLKKRFRTIGIPYILWNIIFVLWYVLLAVIPGLDKFNNSGNILEIYLTQPIWKSLYDLFIVPAAFQLWFLRDLLAMLIFTPILWWITNKKWWIALLLAFASILFYQWLVFFWMGMILSKSGKDIFNYKHPAWLIILCVLIYVGNAIYYAIGHTHIKYGETFVYFAGLFLLWYVYDLLSHNKLISHSGIWKYLCGYSFFIYCFHEPTFNIIKKLVTHVIGTSEFTLIFFYFINPWIMIIVAVTVAKILKHLLPGPYKILTGGR